MLLVAWENLFHERIRLHPSALDRQDRPGYRIQRLAGMTGPPIILKLKGVTKSLRLRREGGDRTGQRQPGARAGEVILVMGPFNY